MSKRALRTNDNIESRGVGESSESRVESVWTDIMDYLSRDLLAHPLAHPHVAHSFGTYAILYKVMMELETKSLTLKALGKLGELDRRTLTHSSMIEKLEAAVDVLVKKEGEIEAGKKWPSYASEDFERIVENVRNLENAGDDKAQILYYMMELETLLGGLEEKARATNRKYEARLSASLRDICRVHEPSKISEKQIGRFTASTRALIEGWGKLNREKVSWIRSRLLEIGLTWLPITDKAAKDISKAQTLTE